MKKTLPSDQVIKAAAAIFNRETASLARKNGSGDHTALVTKLARLIRAAAELKSLGL